jgi:hypothetical protein
MCYDNGSRVAIVVPFGPNAGQVCGHGTVIGFITSGIDGRCYFVREDDGTTVQHSDSWMRKAR